MCVFMEGIIDVVHVRSNVKIVSNSVIAANRAKRMHTKFSGEFVSKLEAIFCPMLMMLTSMLIKIKKKLRK